MANEERKRGNEPGPTAATVSFNVKRLRTQAGLDLRALSSRLTDIGHPISASALSKLENNERRADVDDLVALAVALGANPNAILFQPTLVGGHYLDITGATDVDAERLWAWAKGEEPIALRGLKPGESHKSVNALRDDLKAAWAAEREKYRALVAPGYPDNPGPGVHHYVPDANQQGSGATRLHRESVGHSDE